MSRLAALLSEVNHARPEAIGTKHLAAPRS
jgi:hypothetical protein